VRHIQFHIPLRALSHTPPPHSSFNRPLLEPLSPLSTCRLFTVLWFLFISRSLASTMTLIMNSLWFRVCFFPAPVSFHIFNIFAAPLVNWNNSHDDDCYSNVISLLMLLAFPCILCASLCLSCCLLYIVYAKIIIYIVAFQRKGGPEFANSSWRNF